jgi:ATP-dependent protease ClpP protease subunit
MPFKAAIPRVFNFGAHEIRAVVNAADCAAPVELMVYDSIGKDPWSGGGISAADFRNMLNDVCPGRDRALNILLNSKGGDVREGMAIRNELSQWPKPVNFTITGVAASTASWLPPKNATVKAYRNSQVFIHDAIAYGGGTAEDFRKAADDLDKTSNQIADMYAERTGRRSATMRNLMLANTLMTGEEAKAEGLVDELIDGKAARNFLPEELNAMREQISAFKNSVRQGGDGHQKPPSQTMNKTKLIALLNTLGVIAINGVTVSEETPIEALEQELSRATNALKTKASAPPAGQPNDQIKGLQDQINQLTEANNTAKRLRITNEVETLIANDQLPAGLKDRAIARALGDETYLNELRSLPARPPGAAPLSAERIECVSESFTDVQNFILENGPRFMNGLIGARAGDRERLGLDGLSDVRDRSIVVANTIAKHKPMLTSMFNTNTIDSNLQRTVILQEMLEEFAVILKRFDSFSTVFSNVPLEGTDTVAVPFYDLAADAGNSWDPSTGYATMGNTATGVRTVAVGGSGTTSGSSAAANTAKDRKWVGLEFSSYELARQPYVNWQKHAGQKANRLGVLIFTDVVSRVITAANFGSAVKTVPAAGFSADDVADLWASASGANWPDSGRSLTVNHTYWQALIKDPAFKQYLASGSTETIRKAQITEAYGFQNMIPVPNLTSYSPSGENLVGWINWMYAVLVATAPIMPTPEVRALMTRYDIVTDPKTGITFEYRRFGNTTLDKTQEVIECSYGAAKGVANALKRLTSA